MAQNKVKVTADQHGNVIIVSKNNPEYGSIRVEQEAIQINEQGWLKTAKRFAFIKGKVEELAACKYKKGDEIVGKIVVKESFEPFNPENPEKNLKMAGNSGVVCRYNDQPIYRESFFTTNMNAHDELIMHTNREEIKEVITTSKASDIMKALSL